MAPAGELRDEHRALVTRIEEAFANDALVVGAWIEGSVAAGTDDAGSDLDVHLALLDQAFAGYGRPADELLARIARPLGFLDSTFGGVRVVASTLEGPVRLDLYLEPEGKIRENARFRARRMIFDRAEVAAALEESPEPTFSAAGQLQALVRGFFFGGMWPVRMWMRGDWGSLLMNDLRLVYDFIVPARLIAEGSPEFYREPHSRARFLSSAARADIDALLAELSAVFAGLPHPDEHALGLAQAHLTEALWAALRQAAARTGIEYPEESEREYRSYFARSGIPIRAS
ncbi:MAG: hypothetical protein U0360_00310 [Dehalococcoidia bacterium]